MFYIRTDANETIALGHLMRCLAIADAVKSLGEAVTFIKADHYENTRIEEAGHSVICLNSDWRDMDSELPALKAYIADCKMTSIFIDSYQVTTKYLEELHQLVKVFYFDDLADIAYPVDAVINYAFADQSQIYRKLYPDNRTICLLGSRYAPLRKEFQHLKARITKDKISDILVTTGGSDPFHILHLVAERLASNAKYQDICFHLVLGACVEDSEAEHIKKEAALRGNVRCYRNIRNIEELMQQCDLAISAAGSTLYELCACQTPTICFAFADNQLPGIAAMKQADIMLTIGDIRNRGTDYIEAELIKRIDELHPFHIRESYAVRMHSVTDGQGANRIARKLMK